MKTLLSCWRLAHYITPHPGEHICAASGEVHGHKEQSAMSSFTVASYIVGIRVNSDHLEVQMHDNTLYQLYYEEVSPELFEYVKWFEGTKHVVELFCNAAEVKAFAGHISAVRDSLTTRTQASDDEFNNVVDILMKRYEAT